MNKLYDTIEFFCSLKGKTVYGMCNELGISKGALFNLKQNEKKSLSTKTLKKIADYLELSIDVLVGSSAEKEQKNRDDELKFALFGRSEVSDEMFEEVKRYAQYVLGKSEGYF